MTNNYLELVFDYTHNIYSCDLHKREWLPNLLPSIIIIEATGFYKRKESKLENNLYRDSKREIMQVLFRKNLNALQLKKILGYSYPTIYEHIKTLKRLRLVELIKGKSEKGKREIKLKIHKDVRIYPLLPDSHSVLEAIKEQIKKSEKELSDFDKWLSEKIKEISSSPTVRKSEK